MQWRALYYLFYNIRMYNPLIYNLMQNFYWDADTVIKQEFELTP